MPNRRYVAVLASAERTAAPSSVVVDVPPDAKGALVLIDVTVDGAAASITPTISGVVPHSGTEYTLLVGAAIDAVGVTALELGPGMDDTANVVESALLPTRIVFDMAHADTDAITYGVDIVFV